MNMKVNCVHCSHTVNACTCLCVLCASERVCVSVCACVRVCVCACVCVRVRTLSDGRAGGSLLVLEANLFQCHQVFSEFTPPFKYCGVCPLHTHMHARTHTHTHT